MARPFAVWGFSVYGALLLAAWAGPGAARAAFWVCAAAGLCLALVGPVKALWPGKRRLLPLAGAFAQRAPLLSVGCILMAAALACFLVRFSACMAPVQQWAGKRSAIKARVLDYPQRRYHRYYYNLLVEEVDKTTVRPFTLRLSAAAPLYCEPYDWVECSVGFYAFDGEGGPYSQRNTQFARGCQLGGYLAGGGGRRVPCEEASPGKALVELRRGLSRQLARMLPEEDAGLLQGMLLGDRDNLMEDAYLDFRLIGCAHLLAVSGLHMGAVQVLASSLLRRAGARGRVKALLVAGVLLGYLCVTGFPVSAVRAFLMCGVRLLGECLGRRADSLNSLGFALLLICLQDPLSGGDLSLALSVFATLGILVLAPKITEALLRPARGRAGVYRLCKPVAASFGVTFSVMVFTAPWQVAAFKGVSLWTPVANLLLVLPCTLLLYCGLLALVFSVVPGLAGLAAPFAFCAGWCSRFARAVAGWMGSVPEGYVHLGDGEAAAALYALVILALFLVPGWMRARRRVMAGMLAVCLVGAVLLRGGAGGEAVTVAVCGSGEDAAVVIVQGHRAAVLQAGAWDNRCVDLLRRERVWEVDTLFLPEGGAPQKRCGAQVLEAFPVGRAVLPGGAYVGREFDPENTGVPVAFVGAGGSFEILPGIWAVYGGDRESLALTVYGVEVSVGLSKDGPAVLVGQGVENSPFTVLPADAIIDVTPGGTVWDCLRAGRYVLPGDSGVRLLIGARGDVTVWEGR